MKKIIIITILLFTSSSLNAAEKKDCSSIKKLSKEYLACLKNNISKTGEGNSIIQGFKEKKPLLEIFKKKD